MGRRSGVWERRGRGWFTKIQGRQIKLDATTREEAIAALERLLRPHVEGTPAAGGAISSLTVAGLARRYMEAARHRVRPCTLKSYAESIDAFARHAGEMPAVEVRAHHVTTWLQSRTWAQSSWATRGGHVRMMFRWGVDQELVPGYHFARLRLPGICRREPATEADAAAFRAAIGSGELADWFDLAVSCGARPGELWSLTASGIARDRRSAAVAGKTGKRTVYFPDAVGPILDRLRAAHPEGPILRGKFGQPWTKEALGNRFRAASVGCGAHVVCYSLRGIFASRCFASGSDGLLVEALLGHRGGSVLARHYLSISPDMLMTAVDRAWAWANPSPDPPA